LPKKFDLYLEFGREKLKQLKNYRDIAKKVKEMVQERLGKADVYVFGSLIESEPTASSDIDILVVADNISHDEIYKLKAKVYESIEAPIELHIVSTREFENWYKRFINKLEKIV
jgi:hypothetical protein